MGCIGLIVYCWRLSTTPTLRLGLLASIDANLYLTVLYRLLKSLIRLIDGKSELARALNREIRGGAIDNDGRWQGPVRSTAVIEVERIIMQSHVLRDEQLALVADEATGARDEARDLALDIARRKGIDASQPSFAVLTQIVAILRSLFIEQGRLLDRTATKCNVKDAEHERHLRELWMLLKPEQQLSGLVTKQWQEIGFQGTNPETDFRSVGMLGLDCLLSFARSDPPDAQRIVKEAVESEHWYPFAIASLSITDHVLHLVKSGALHPLAFLSADDDDSTALFRAHTLYARLFHSHWRFIHTPPLIGPGVMGFEQVFKAFRTETERWARRGVIGGWLDDRGFLSIPLSAAEALIDDDDKSL